MRHRLLTVRARLVLVAAVTVTALVVLVAVNAARDWEQQAALRSDSATGELGGERVCLCSSVRRRSGG